jgi:hypothetical protein
MAQTTRSRSAEGATIAALSPPSSGSRGRNEWRGAGQRRGPWQLNRSRDDGHAGVVDKRLTHIAAADQNGGRAISRLRADAEGNRDHAAGRLTGRIGRRDGSSVLPSCSARARHPDRGRPRPATSRIFVIKPVMLVGIVSMIRLVFTGHPHGKAEHLLDEAQLVPHRCMPPFVLHV